MWPAAKGSVQPLGNARVVIKPRSRSAPNLRTLAPCRASLARLSLFGGPVNYRQPQYSSDRLLSERQLREVEHLSSDEALQYISCCLPAETSDESKTTVAVLMYTVFHWARSKQFTREKTIFLMTIYYRTCMYCQSSQWITRGDAYTFFKESLLCCTFHHPPTSMSVFKPQECKDSLLHFCRGFLTSLPLMQFISSPLTRLRCNWDSD